MISPILPKEDCDDSKAFASFAQNSLMLSQHRVAPQQTKLQQTSPVYGDGKSFQFFIKPSTFLDNTH